MTRTFCIYFLIYELISFCTSQYNIFFRETYTKVYIVFGNKPKTTPCKLYLIRSIILYFAKRKPYHKQITFPLTPSFAHWASVVCSHSSFLCSTAFFRAFMISFYSSFSFSTPFFLRQRCKFIVKKLILFENFKTLKLS